MEIRAVTILSCWVSTAIISVIFVWTGGATLGNYVFVGLLIFLAFLITFGIGFGLRPSKREKIELLSEIKNIKSKLDELSKEVEEIKKAIEE